MATTEHAISTGDTIKVETAADGTRTTTITLAGLGEALTSTDSDIAEAAERAQDKAGETGWEVIVTYDDSTNVISKIGVEKTV